MSPPDVDSTLSSGAALGAIAERKQLAVAGPDRASFLHGLLSNDIQGLTPGHGCYAAWLTPQGRMLCDMHVLESGDMILLDVPAAEASSIAERLEQFHFAEDVQIEDLSQTLTVVWLHGAGAAALLARLDASGDGRPGDGAPYAAWEPYRNARADVAGTSVVIARIDQLGVPGYALFVAAAQAEALTRALVEAGAVPASRAALEAARIDAGYPVFGVDMTSETIPLEAGIEDRAISLTKGCYVGQEVIIRILHRGGGRVVRKLVRLDLTDGLPRHGDRIVAADKDIGFVTSAAAAASGRSSVALGYVHRDYLGGGTAVEILSGTQRLHATVASRG